MTSLNSIIDQSLYLMADKYRPQILVLPPNVVTSSLFVMTGPEWARLLLKVNSIMVCNHCIHDFHVQRKHIRE